MQSQDRLPSDQPKPRLSNYEVAERAANANAVLNDPVLVEALNDIYSKAVGTLLDAEIGSLTASAAHATMKTIMELRSQLKQYVDDDKIRQKYNKGDK